MTKNKMDKEKIEEGVRLILEGIGEDINREGLLETPDRIARMLQGTGGQAIPQMMATPEKEISCR